MLQAIKSDKFDKWIRKLDDYQALNRINARIARICANDAFIGDCKQVGGGVTEVRVQGHGPGYRIYGAIRDNSVLLLLVAGDKASQVTDINMAIELLTEWDKRSQMQRVHAEEGNSND